MNRDYPHRRANPRFGIILGALLCLVCFLSLPVLAQKTSGQISGTIFDAGGAALPDTTLVVTQVGTGLQRTVTSSSDGNYTVTDLPIGIYRVAVTKSGFKEAVVENLSVNVASITRQDVTLQVGGVGETVTITADAIQVETQTGAIGEVVNGQQVRELPLNGRSFVQLTQLQPGVAAQNNFDTKNKGLFAGVDFSVNGNSAQSNLFLTDGANNNDTGSNRTILLYPSIEAIAEFKMLRNSYGPEYGQAAGSVISIVTRGGENKFHGSLFYFGRNDALNSTEYFSNLLGSKKDELRRNDYGGSIGGPLPFFNFGEGGPLFRSGKDRLFFFFSQEYNKEIRGALRQASVPTAAQRTGDFRNPRPGCNDNIIGKGRPGDLLGRNGIASNAFTTTDQVIPASQLSPAGLLVAQLYPLPNIANSNGCINWAQSIPSKIDFKESNGRIDANLTKNNHIFGRYTQDLWENPYPILESAGLWGDDPFPAVESNWSQPSRQLAIKLTTTLSNTSVNEVQFSYSANRINITAGNGGQLNEQINQAIPSAFGDSVKVNGINRPHPVFWGGSLGYPDSLWTEAPFHNSLDIYSLRDDFSKVAGNHTFKMGFLYDRAAKTEDSGPNNEAPQFWGTAGDATNSGNNLADALTLGSNFGFSETNREPVGNTAYRNLEFYFGDTWKVRQNITLELGARYSILYEPYDTKNAISAFNPTLYNAGRPATDPCNGLVVPKGAGNPCANIAGASAPTVFSNRSLRDNNYKNIAPRLGFAWDLFNNGKSAIRGGFGQFYLRERVSPYVSALTTNPPFALNLGGVRPLDSANLSSLGGATAGAPAFALDPGAKTPYSLQYNITFDQEIYKGGVIEVGYVGNQGRNQLTQYDVNEVPAANRLAAAFMTDGASVNPLRPYSNFGSIYSFSRSGRSAYNSLQVLFKTRFLKRSQFQAAYTHGISKSDFGLGQSGGGRFDDALLDINNRSLSYGPSDINRPNLFVANTVINLPGFKESNALLRNVLGGWEVASIVQITSGTSLTPTIGSNTIRYLNANGDSVSFGGGISGIGSAVANQRPLFAGGDCNVTGGNSLEQTLNQGAYTLAGYQIGTLGSQSSKGACLGPPTKNVDLSFYKNFNPGWLTSSFFGEGARVQLRIEMFNAFNTPQFRNPNSLTNFTSGTVVCGNAVCSPTNNTITGFAPGSGPTSDFGRSTTTRGGREIQYALKLVF